MRPDLRYYADGRLLVDEPRPDDTARDERIAVLVEDADDQRERRYNRGRRAYLRLVESLAVRPQEAP